MTGPRQTGFMTDRGYGAHSLGSVVNIKQVKVCQLSMEQEVARKRAKAAARNAVFMASLPPTETLKQWASKYAGQGSLRKEM